MVCGSQGLPRYSPYDIATWLATPFLDMDHRSTTTPATTHSASWLREAAGTLSSK